MLSIKKLTKALIWFCVHAIAFILLAWLLLGLTPTQTVQTSYDNIMGLINGTKNFSRGVTKTAGSMSNVAQHHLNEAAERIDGKDPYENYNANISNKVHGDFKN